MSDKVINDNKIAFGQLIKKKRREKGYTQQDLAAMIGIQPKSISFIERGINLPASENIFALAKILDLSLDEFIFGYSKFDANFCIEDINDLLNSLSDDDRNIVVATVKTLCEALVKKENSRKNLKQ